METIATQRDTFGIITWECLLDFDLLSCLCMYKKIVVLNDDDHGGGGGGTVVPFTATANNSLFSYFLTIIILVSPTKRKGWTWRRKKSTWVTWHCSFFLFWGKTVHTRFLYLDDIPCMCVCMWLHSTQETLSDGIEEEEKNVAKEKSNNKWRSDKGIDTWRFFGKKNIERDSYRIVWNVGVFLSLETMRAHIFSFFTFFIKGGLRFVWVCLVYESFFVRAGIIDCSCGTFSQDIHVIVGVIRRKCQACSFFPGERDHIPLKMSLTPSIGNFLFFYVLKYEMESSVWKCKVMLTKERSHTN